MSMNLNVTSTSYPWATQNPVVTVCGSANAFNVNLAYAALVSSSGLSCTLYKDGKAVTNPASPLTGSITATGTDNNISTKTLATTLPAGTYVMWIEATVDGEVKCAAKIRIQVQGKGDDF